MSGFPVVIVESGGVPYVSVGSGAPVATVAVNGMGMAITLVESGAPGLVIEGGTAPESDWLLSGGAWIDTGEWDDTAVWEDG